MLCLEISFYLCVLCIYYAYVDILHILLLWVLVKQIRKITDPASDALGDIKLMVRLLSYKSQ